MGRHGHSGTGGQGAGKALEAGGVVAEANHVVAEHLILAQLRFIAELDRYIHAAIARHAEFEATAVRLAVEILVHFIDAGRDVCIRRRAHANPARPHCVREGTVADIATRQRFRVAAQGVVHVVAVEWRTGEVVLHVHPTSRDVQPVAEHCLLGVGRDEVHRHVSARTKNLLDRTDIVAEQVAVVGARTVDKDDMGGQPGDSGQALPIDIGQERQLVRRGRTLLRSADVAREFGDRVEAQVDAVVLQLGANAAKIAQQVLDLWRDIGRSARVEHDELRASAAAAGGLRRCWQCRGETDRQSDSASHSVLALRAGMGAWPASSDASICSRLRPFVSGTIRATNANAAMLSRA